jgi:hypothetical protein
MMHILYMKIYYYGGKVKSETIDIIPKMKGIKIKFARERYWRVLAILEHNCAKDENGLYT